MHFILVFIGGGLGSICRYGIARWLNPLNYTFPLATFLANIISCLVLGFLVSLTLKNGINDATKLLLMTGFCGGFSTFSTFTNETFQLLQNGAIWLVFLNVVGSVLICLACIFLGLKLGLILYK